jgi:FkbM family methyltransferase
MSGFVTKRLQDMEWKKTKLLKMEDIGPDSKWQYEIILPDYLYEKDIWAVWEKERFLSMEKNLKKGDILFDIGSECGVMSGILAKFVGGENMVLFEPSSTWWSLIRNIWDKNGLKTPKDTFLGFASNETMNIDDDVEAQIRDGWPNIAWDSDLCVTTAYRYLHEPQHKALLQSITLDDYYALKGIYPDAITMDAEGAEALILKGAEKILKKFKPKVWISVHPDLALKNYGVKAGEEIKYMESLGYTCTHLATDHESHYYCEVK